MNLVTAAVMAMCAGLVYGQSSLCQTPDGKTGDCISILSCDPLLTLVNKTNKTTEDMTLLNTSSCGTVKDVPFEPKVCCPKQTCNTPDGKPGVCVSIYSCPYILNKLITPVPQENVDFVNKSRCINAEKYSVCCGSNPVGERDDVPCQAKVNAFPPNPTSECCGIWAGANDKIIGGSKLNGLPTAIDEHPWTALIEYTKNKDERTSVLCGGALISGKYVLTAAHCIAGSILDTDTPTMVRLGDYDINHNGPDCKETVGGGNDCTDGDTRIAIESTTPHPKYDPELKRNDIGLIRLKAIAPYTDFIRPVCLPVEDRTKPGNTPPYSSMYAVGWGATETRIQSYVKVQVYAPFVSQKKCQLAYNTTSPATSLWKGQLCAGGEKAIDTCTADSGGPLVYDDGTQYQVIGLVSFGPQPCGALGVPGIYTNVYEYLDWIKSAIVR